MRLASITLLAAVSMMVAQPSAFAGTRLYCQCGNGPKTQIFGKNACEYHHKKQSRKTAGGATKYAQCTSREYTAFRTWLCKDLCATNGGYVKGPIERARLRLFWRRETCSTVWSACRRETAAAA
jgi:hypothetical protein